MGLAKRILGGLLVSAISAGAGSGCTGSESTDDVAIAAALAALGVAAGTGTAASTPCSTCRIFLATNSDNYHAANFGGASSADSKCNSDPAKPSASTGSYKAILADTTRQACSTANCSGGATENSNWVLKPNQAYVRSDGTTAIGTTTAAGIFSFPLSATIFATGGFYWTGLQNDWRTDSSNNCSNWATTSGASNGAVGTASSTSNTAIRNSTPACSGTQSLLCAEQ